jgi:hypothetical protein
MILTLTKIINGCLKISYFPKAWKKASIISIPKPGKNHNLPESYRPIALLSSVSKIYERIILQNLKNSLSGKIRKEQFAFRHGHSTSLQLTKLTDQISVNFSQKEQTAAVFLDVEKAFDRVWHQGLLYKMKCMDIPLPLIKIIESFLSNRTFVTKIHNSTSSTRNILAGVPQGSCLSPILFIIFTNDMPVTAKATIALFADDTMFSTKNPNPNRARIQLQEQLNLASEWFQKWRMRVNPSKTVAIIFGRTKTNRIPPIKMGDTDIAWSNQVKYLGVTIGRKLNFEVHVSNIIKKATQTRGMLYSILNRKSPIPLGTRIRLLKMYITPILTYAGAAWAPFIHKSHWRRLEAVQTIGLRVVSGTPTYVKNEILLLQCKTTKIQQNIRAQAWAMFYKNTQSIYPHIKCIGLQNADPRLPKHQIKPRPKKWSQAE